MVCLRRTRQLIKWSSLCYEKVNRRGPRHGGTEISPPQRFGNYTKPCLFPDFEANERATDQRGKDFVAVFTPQICIAEPTSSQPSVERWEPLRNLGSALQQRYTRDTGMGAENRERCYMVQKKNIGI